MKAVRDKPAAAIETARAKKYQTYNPLVYVMRKQVLYCRRRKVPGSADQYIPDIQVLQHALHELRLEQRARDQRA